MANKKKDKRKKDLDLSDEKKDLMEDDGDEDEIDNENPIKLKDSGFHIEEDGEEIDGEAELEGHPFEEDDEDDEFGDEYDEDEDW